MKQENEKYCSECGSLINIKAEICPKCGVRQTSNNVVVASNEWLTVLLLCIFLGPLGVHRFYSGHTLIGILQLITLGGCGIWTLIDIIIIVTGKYTDAQGNPITNG